MSSASSLVKAAEASPSVVRGSVRRGVAKPIWIDLDNSPHVPFFAPIIEELERRGYPVFVTARDAYQVSELVELFHLNCARVGRHYGKHKILKVLGTCFRAFQLSMIVRGRKLRLAVSHGSRSQTLASLLLRIPSVAIFDYEFANVSALFRATWLMVPEIVADSTPHFKGDKVLKYPGIKEDVYAPRFKPEASILSLLGLEGGDVVVTVRPPATEAHYHRPESDTLFEAVMEFLGQAPNVKAILLPRNAKQSVSVRNRWPDLFSTGKAVIPDQAVDGLNLIWHSDLVISGGGTMNREAAALGVPVYSIFRGKIGAVDRYLASSGRMILVESVDQVRTKISLTKRAQANQTKTENTNTLGKIVDELVAILDSQS